jgi:hypothetical protein
MANIKAKNSAAKRLHKIDHFLGLIERMAPSLDSKDCDIVAEYLTRRVYNTCDKILKSSSMNVFKMGEGTEHQPQKNEIYCSRCNCWHDRALHKGDKNGDTPQ